MTAHQPTGSDTAKEEFSLDGYLPQMLNMTVASMNERLAAELKTIGLSVPHWRILAIVHWLGTSTLSEIQQKTVIDTSTLSRSIKRLEVDGLVVRAWSAKDSRARAIALTPEGEAVFKKGWRIVSRFYAYIFEDLDPASRTTMFRALETVQQRLGRSYWY